MHRNTPADPSRLQAPRQRVLLRAPRGCMGAALPLSLCKEWNHLQKQIATFKVLIGSLSNLALIIHTREHKNLVICSKG